MAPGGRHQQTLILASLGVLGVLAVKALDEKFLAEAKKRRLSGLKGHRSVGGMRASIYNAFPPAGVEALVELMRDFEKANG